MPLEFVIISPVPPPITFAMDGTAIVMAVAIALAISIALIVSGQTPTSRTGSNEQPREEDDDINVAA